MCTHAFECLLLSVKRGFRRVSACVELGCLFTTTKIDELLQGGWVVVVVEKITSFFNGVFQDKFQLQLPIKIFRLYFLLCRYSCAAEAKQATAQRIAHTCYEMHMLAKLPKMLTTTAIYKKFKRAVGHGGVVVSVSP